MTFKASDIWRPITKYYLCDQSFKYAKLGTKNADYGRSIESIVAVELLRRGYELYAEVLYKKESDFAAIKRSGKLYIQVANTLMTWTYSSGKLTLCSESRTLISK